jgi:mono/diheme cytochrome c family protein
LGDDNLWKNPQPLLESPESKRIALGQQLYKKECATCHSENLRNDMTGPALGNVHLFRTEKWLLDFTLNSSQMIRDLDSVAICLWHQWKPMAMTSFEGVLSAKEISDIYFFIENESKLQKIENNEVKYITECNRSTSNHGQDSSMNTKREFQVPTSTASLFWNFLINDLGWKNIDCLLSRNDIQAQKIETFEVKLNGIKGNTSVAVLLVLEKRNVVLGVYGLNSEGNFIFPEGYKLILPKEGATILAIDSDYDYASKKIIIGDTNFHTLKLEPKSKEEFTELIKNL